MADSEWKQVKIEVSQVNKKRETKKAFYRDSYSYRDNTDKFDKEILEIKVMDDDERIQYKMRDPNPLYPNIIYCTAYNKTEHTYEDVHWFLKKLVWKSKEKHNV